jgi:hypothetical protein
MVTVVTIAVFSKDLGRDALPACRAKGAAGEDCARGERAREQNLKLPHTTKPCNAGGAPRPDVVAVRAPDAEGHVEPPSAPQHTGLAISRATRVRPGG